MMRIENWDTWLVRFTLIAIEQPFDWGRTDCASLTRRALTLIYGADPWVSVVGRWTTRTGAVRAARLVQGFEVALRTSGAVQVGVPYGTSGDVALGPGVDDLGLPRLSVLLPNRRALTATPELGVVIVDKLALLQGTTFWRYG